jgi:transcriptional regulator with XRE-family HTH domain/Zn-dependent peptidase ImmA (M78 family)
MDAEAGLGQRLRTKRTALGLSLREVERRSGVNSGYLSQLERNEITSPGPSLLLKIADVYDEPISVLMRWAGYVEDGLSPNAQRALSMLGNDFTDEELSALRAVLEAIRQSGRAASTPMHRTDLILPLEDLAVIRRHARAVLREVDAADVTGPVHLDEVMRLAKLVRAGDIELTLEERRGLRARFGHLADRMLSLLQGVLHFGSGDIYVDHTMHELKQRFVTSHEIGHWVLPDHRIAYACLDDHQRLSADYHDRLERQANVFAIELLAKGDQLTKEWDSSAPGAQRLTDLSRRYAVSIQAVARRVAEESRRPLAIAIAHKRGTNGPLQPARLYSSHGFEHRKLWKESTTQAQLQAALQEVASISLLPPTREIAGSLFMMDALDTPYAAFAVFWLPKRLWRPPSLLRTNEVRVATPVTST